MKKILKLDFSLETDTERAEYVKRYLPEGEKLTAKEKETIANYLLFGKEADGKSVVDKKEVQIRTKYSTYRRKDAESLDSLMESPTFDERIFEKGATKYRAEKPKIDREKDKDVPGIQELWKTIDYCQHLLNCAQGKETDPLAPKLTEKQRYQLSHEIVEMRRQQFLLRDMVKPTICRYKLGVTPVFQEFRSDIPWDEEDSPFAILPLGLIDPNSENSPNTLRIKRPRLLEERDYSPNKNASYILDFCNPEHIYQLFEHYQDLEFDASFDGESTIHNLLATLNYYTEKAFLSPAQRDLISYKIARTPNEKIAQHLFEDYGKTYSANYISTIYKKKICVRIAEAAQLNFDEYWNREDPTKWKKCSKCGQDYLVDARSFMRRARSADGFTSICKHCEKEKRERKKEAK